MKSKIILFLSIWLISSCANKYDPVQPFIVNKQYNKQQSTVFNAALSVATLMNLNVAVIEKSSGLIRFSNDSYDASLLDHNCTTTIVDGNGRPKYTFEKWNYELMEKGFPPLIGTAQVTLLVSTESGRSNINLRTNFKANGIAVNSTGKLEKTFIKYLEEKLGKDSRTNFNY